MSPRMVVRRSIERIGYLTAEVVKVSFAGRYAYISILKSPNNTGHYNTDNDQNDQSSQTKRAGDYNRQKIHNTHVNLPLQ
jgi:hypothetical protein